MFRNAVLAVLSIVLGFSVSHPAEARKVTLSYIGYLSGVPVLDLVATIEAPEGVILTEGEYKIAASVATSGNFARLYPFRQNMTSEGVITGGLPNPSSHHLRQVIWGRTFKIALTYGPDGVVSIDAYPPTIQAESAEKEGYANNTLDPASAVVALSTLYTIRKNCGAKIAVFDGTRRFDLDLIQRGASDVPKMAKSVFAGLAAKCDVKPTLKAGFQMSTLASDLYPREASLWMASPVPDFPSVPVRIATKNGFGEMTLDLVAAKYP